MSSLYQCQPSSQSSDQVFIPNIPDFYFDDANAATFRGDGVNNLTVTGRRGTTFVFTVPAVSPERNCSGAVMSIQYCHQARASDIGQTRNIFDLITLRRNGLNFTVLTRDDVRYTLQSSMCSDPPGDVQRVCYTTQTFSIQLPASSFSYGVVNNANNLRLLTFSNSVTDFDVERFSIRQHGDAGPMPGDTLLPGCNFAQRLDRSLFLLRFFLGIFVKQFFRY